MIRAILFFSGRVQGVGFQYSTYEIAKRFAVFGTVENCDDGRVKIVVEAESSELDRFIDAIASSSTGQIKSMERFDSASSHEFTNFSVRR
jgi:acylphosphatase